MSKLLKSWTTYICDSVTAAKYPVPVLVLIINDESVCVGRAQNSFCHFYMVVAHTTFGFLVVAAFLESSNMPTAD